ncbi:MAG: alpha/beta fold hydrolase [Kurthia sp.]|nr:alpha/beta fold hydrolase [Candidatus Kurthia equi]
MTLGILFLHGFTGNTEEIQPLVDYLSAHRTDWIYSVPTLSGHGSELNLKGINASHWLSDVEIAYRLLAKKVDKIIVIGFSMGGVLALYLTLRYKVNRLVLLSPSLKYLDVKQLYLALIELINNRKNITTQQKVILKKNMYQAQNMKIPTVLSFREVVNVVTPYVTMIERPVMIVQGKKDGLVPSATADFIYEKVASAEKKIYFSPNGYHQICFSEDRLHWFKEVLAFILASEKEN